MSQPKELLSHNLTYLKMVGLWPIHVHNNVIKLLHKIYGIILFLYAATATLSQIIDLIFNIHMLDLQKVTTNLTTSLMSVMGLRKIYSLLRHGAKYEKIMAELTTKDRNIPKSKDISAIYSKTLYRARLTSYLYWGLVIMTIIFMICSPFVDYDTTPNYCCRVENGTRILAHVRPFIFSSWLPVSAIDYYYTYYAIQFVAVIIGGSYQAVWDAYFVSLLIHVIGQIKVLNYRITKIGSKDTETNKTVKKLPKKYGINFREKLSEQKNYDDLVACIKEHVYIIRFVKTLNEITSPIMFLYYFVCGLMLCAQGFQILLHGFTINLKMQYLVALLIQLFIFFWHANELTDEINRLTFATYECKWYNQSNPFKKSLINFRSGLMLRVNFTAGRFFVMSIPTFLGVLKMAYSFFAVLMKVQKEKAMK